MTIITRKDALAAGLRFYFTGKACPRGHISERYVTAARCAKCLEEDGKGKQEYLAAYYQKHRDKIRKRTAKWYRQNYEHARAAQAISSRLWWKNNPYKRRQYNHSRRAKVRNAGTYDAACIIELLKEQKHKCAYCSASIRNTFQVDHIIPIGRDGKNERTNLQILCKTCNRKKWKHDPLDFARSIGLLL